MLIAANGAPARLLAFQQMVALLPDDAAIAAFTRRTLLAWSNATAAWICINGNVIGAACAMDERFAGACHASMLAADAPAELDVPACNASSGARCFPVWSGSHLFGLLIIEPAAGSDLQSQVAVIECIAGSVAAVLETRRFQASLAENLQSRQLARDDLVIRIAETSRATARVNQRLQRLSEQLLTAHENERRTIAHELHDEIGQVLTAVRIDLEMNHRHADAPDMRKRLQRGMLLIDHAIDQVRDLALNLRPAQLDDIGLVGALRWHIDRLAQSSGLPIEFDADEMPAKLSSLVEVACFRIAQEALTNISRHSHARHAHIQLRVVDQALELSVADDGTGMQVGQDDLVGLGLVGMRERASLVGGTLQFANAPGGGTQICARLPLRKPRARARVRDKVVQ